MGTGEYSLAKKIIPGLEKNHTAPLNHDSSTKSLVSFLERTTLEILFEKW
jgi:hypothetical protein